jgi:hypothetical protein
MTRKAWVAVLGVMGLFAGGCLRASEAEKAAEAAASTWLATVDAGLYGKSWDEAAAMFQAAVGRAQWEAALTQVRQPLGALVSRKLRGAKYTTEVPGAPAGEYVILQFDTSFANGSGKTETVTPMKGKDGTWRVSGYYIK